MGEYPRRGVPRAVAAFSDMLIKHEMPHGPSEAHRFPRGAATSAPSNEHDLSAVEDNGYVHDPRRGAADLVILAEQDFGDEPVAAIHVPARVPLGFHRNWIAET